MRNPLDQLKHGDTLYALLEPNFESWMSKADKLEYVILTLQSTGKTLNELDADVEVGVQNGYSPEEQIQICWELFFKDQEAPLQ